MSSDPRYYQPFQGGFGDVQGRQVKPGVAPIRQLQAQPQPLAPVPQNQRPPQRRRREKNRRRRKKEPPFKGWILFSTRSGNRAFCVCIGNARKANLCWLNWRIRMRRRQDSPWPPTKKASSA